MQELVMGTGDRLKCSDCQVDAPLRYVEFHSMAWPGWRYVSTEGELCRSCIGNQFLRHLVLKLTGTPGIIGLVANPIFLVNDFVRYVRARKLPRHHPRTDA